MVSQTQTMQDMMLEHGHKICGLCTPEQFATMVKEDILFNDSQLIGLDCRDTTLLLSGSTTVDAIRVSGSKTEIRQMLENGMEQLTAAHPDQKICEMMVQILAPAGALLMEDMNVYSDFLSQFENVSIKWGLSTRDTPNSAIQTNMIVGFK